MSLSITDIRFQKFRSYTSFNLSNIGNLTIFVGPNAVGKTNIVEGIGLLTSLSSFRHALTKELIKTGEERGKISIDVTDGNRQLSIDLELEEAHKSYRLNGKKKKTSDLKGLIPSVSFSPDDLNLIKGSNTQRRKSLDLLGSQLNNNYYQLMKDYDKVLRHKNKLLKDEAPRELFEAIDELVIKVGSQLTVYRMALFNNLLKHMKVLYKEITGSEEKLEGMYTPSFLTESVVKLIDNRTKNPFSEKTSESITQEETVEGIGIAINLLRDDEIARKRTLIGPQRDEISFCLDNMDSSTFASQGQQRSIVLVWKLAEAQLIEEMTGQLPILLLDDVMSELDEVRRAALVSYLSEDIQTFITTANIDYFEESLLSRANIINVGELNSVG